MSDTGIPASLQRRVRARAADQCEYCRLPQHGQEATFHVDHIVPRRAHGPTTLDNLALACVSCSLRKGARTRVEHPDGGEPVSLFHPRRESWTDHFAVAGDGTIDSTTLVGRATIAALAMNRQSAIAIRWELMQLRRHP